MKFELFLLPLSVVREGVLVDGMAVGQVLFCSSFSMSVLILLMLCIHLAVTVDIVVIVAVAPVQGTQPHYNNNNKKKKEEEEEEGKGKYVLNSVSIGLIVLQYLRFVCSWLAFNRV
jgi:hypothetical protein